MSIPFCSWGCVSMYSNNITSSVRSTESEAIAIWGKTTILKIEQETSVIMSGFVVSVNSAALVVQHIHRTWTYFYQTILSLFPLPVSQWLSATMLVLLTAVLYCDCVREHRINILISWVTLLKMTYSLHILLYGAIPPGNHSFIQSIHLLCLNDKRNESWGYG